MREDKPPVGVSKPKSLREGRRRLRKARDTMKDIEMQLASPDVCDKAGERLTHPEWESWKARAYHVLRRTQVEYSYLKYWLGEARAQIRALEAGVGGHTDANALLNGSLKLMRSIRKCEALPKDLHADTKKMADIVEAYLTRDAEVA